MGDVNALWINRFSPRLSFPVARFYYRLRLGKLEGSLYIFQIFYSGIFFKRLHQLEGFACTFVSDFFKGASFGKIHAEQCASIAACYGHDMELFDIKCPLSI